MTRLPGRIVGRPAQRFGPHQGVGLDNERLVAGFYREMDWDPETGVPGEERLERLGLREVKRDLYGS